MEEKIKKLEETIAELKATVSQLAQKVEELENGSFGTGVYLDGVSDYNKDFITSKKGEK